MALPIALQLYSVRDELAKDLCGTIRKVKEMGYDGVELPGLNGADPEVIKNLAAELGLEVISSHVSVQELLTDIPAVIESYKAAGCKYIAIPYMHYGENGEKLEENLEIIRKIAEVAKEHGVTLLYHNHDFEFQKVNGKFILDTIYDEIPEDLLKTQVDTCWVRFSGNDPAAYVRKYTGRAPLVHLKDFWSNGNKDCVPYALIGESEEGDAKAAVFEFRPVGSGIQDMPSILEASKDAGATWVIVEQDESVGRTTMEAAKMSIDYLRSLEW